MNYLSFHIFWRNPWNIARPIIKFVLRRRATSEKCGGILQTSHFPMLWYLPDPLHSRILHRYLRVKPLSNCMTDKCSALLLQQFNHLLFLGYQSADFGCFAVKEVGNDSLFV